MKKAPKSLLSSNLANKTVLVRVDYNVPTQDGIITDDYKIRSSIATIQYLLKNNCKVVLLSHIGDPKGKQDDNLSLMDVRFALGRLLEKQIKFANISACENSIKFMDFGEVLMLENLKFSPLETSKKEEDRLEYVKNLSRLADAFVYECYGAESNLASINALAGKLPTYMGIHFEEELSTAQLLAEKSKETVTAVIGNEDLNKVLDLITVLVNGKNKLLLGGEIALYFLNAMGTETGSKVLEPKILSKVSKCIKAAKKNGCEIILPVDHLAVKNGDSSLKSIEVQTQTLPADLLAMDIGPKTLVSFREIIEASNVIIWFGSMGEYNFEQFNKGTEAIGEYIALSTSKDCYKVAFGGIVTHAMNLLKIKPKRFNFVSLDSSLLADFMQNKESDILTLLS